MHAQNYLVTQTHIHTHKKSCIPDCCIRFMMPQVSRVDILTHVHSHQTCQHIHSFTHTHTHTRTHTRSVGDVAAFKDYKPTGGGAAAATPAPAAPAAAAPAAAAAPGKIYPSHQAMEMPALSPTMTAGNIAAIKVKPGV